MNHKQSFAQSRLLIKLKEILRLQKIFLLAGIEPIYLKGFFQHWYLTKKWLTRDFFDFDLLIKRCDVDKIYRLLCNEEYRPTFHISFSQPSIKQALYEPQIIFRKMLPGNVANTIDLHIIPLVPSTNIFPVISFQLANQISRQFFSRSRSVIFNRLPFGLLNNEDMLIHQCLNYFFHHACRGASQLADIGLIIKRLPLDWSVVMARLGKWQLEEFAYYPLSLAADIKKVLVPLDVLAQIKPRHLLAFLAPLFINSQTYTAPIENNFVRYRYNLLLQVITANRPVADKIRVLGSPAVVNNILRKPVGLLQLLFSTFPITNKHKE